MDLIGKPRSKSVVWMYFGFRADENGFPLRSDEVICRLCRKIVLAKGGNTTNLRSHLKRRHRAEIANSPFSASLGVGPETAVLDQSHEELIQELQSLSAQADSNHNYVPDAVLPPGEPWLHGGPSRAALSLPSCLSLSEFSKPHSPTSESYIIDMKVLARCHLQVGIMFGPYIGEMCKGHVPDNLKYAWAIRDESAFAYVDGSDPNISNWMRFVTFTSCEDEHNLTVFQFYRKIYYKVSQPISEGDELKVWVGRDYASLLGLDYTGENMKCQVGEKESFLRPLQDIQLVTLPEPSSSALWSDHSQSQSPMPIISEVTSMNTGGASGHSSPAVPSSLGYLPGPHPFENKYHFLPGTERLVGNPDVSHAPIYGEQSLWYFFGFEPDHTGRPLDKTTAICKLCGDHVSCGGGVYEIKSHLNSKHQIKQRETSNTSSQRLSAVPRSIVPTSTASASSVTVTDSILYFLITDLQPPSFVRGKGFQHLISSLLPHIRELPSKTKLEFLLNELYTKSKTNMAQILRTNTDTVNYMAPLEVEQSRRKKDVPHLVNFSVDVWFHTWQGNTEMYLSLWVHYIDANFTCHNRALSTQKLSKSGLNLKSVESQVRAMGEEWGIFQANLSVLGGEGWDDIRVVPMRSEKVGEASGSNTHPNSTTFLERDESTSPVEQDTERSQTSEGLASVPCFFTAVQSCIDELMSMNAVSKVLSLFQNIVAVLFGEQDQIRGSNEIYATQLSQLMTKEEKVEVKVWAYSRPTWNKLYLLLNMLLKNKVLLRDIINRLKEDTSCESSSSENSTPTGSSQSMRTEWKVVEDLCLVLKPLDVACQTLAKEDFPRLSLIKPILTGLLSRHLVTRPGDSPILKEAKTMMRYNLSHWYDTPTVNRVLNVACALDPQFHGLGFMSDQEQTDTFQWLKKEAVRISNEPNKNKKSQQNKRSPSPSSPDESRRRSKRLKDTEPINFRDIEGSDGEECEIDPDDSEWVEPPPEEGLSGMEFLLGDLYSSGNKSKQRSVEESVEMELNVFRSDNGASPGIEPLQWWKTKTMQLPLLAMVAQAYLSAPAVAGNAAQCYLQEGTGTSRGKRSNIPPENLDAILFLHHNNIQKTKLKLF
uniref:BED-type domain-containing protein n=1 Tax=Neogobius melanostomus TaxID=47308 RepID=A0A8C6T0A1_9GOBI